MKILICENQEIMQTAVEFRLRKIGFESKFVQILDDAIAEMETGTYNILVIDIELNTTGEIDLIEYVRKVMKDTTPIIMLGEYADEEELLGACTRGASDFILRPFKPIELLMRIKKILEPVA